MKSSWEEWGIGFLNDESLSKSFKIVAWLLKGGANRIIFKMDWKDEFFFLGVSVEDEKEGGELSSFTSQVSILK